MKKIWDLLLGKNESLRNTRNYMMGQVINKGLGFLLLPITTALLTLEEYGINSLFTSTVNIFVIILPLCIYKGVTRFYYDKTFDQKEMLGTQFLMMSLYLVATTILAIFTLPLWRGWSGLTIYLCILMLIQTVAQSIINFYLAYLQSRKMSSRYAVLNVLTATFTTLVGVFWMSQLDSNRFLGLIYANIICRIIFALFGIFDMLPMMKFVNNKQMRLEVYRFNIPLIPHMISSFLLNYIDRYMINSIIGQEASGLYSFAYNFGLIINIIVYAINQTFGPEFYELMNEKAYHKIVNKVDLFQKGLLTLSAVVILFSAEVCLIWANTKYHVGIPIIPIICYGYIVSHLYATISCYASYYKRNGYLALVSMSASIINVFLNYYFISMFGYVAAAYTTAISYFIQYFICLWCNKYIMKWPMHNYTPSLINMLVFMLLTYIGMYVISLLELGLILTIVVKVLLLIIVYIGIWFKEVKHVFCK